jgi:SAM-dependent methyltransferase
MSDSSTRKSYDELVDEATSAPVEGWDFSFLHGRIEDEPLPWSYPELATNLITGARRVLDVDTGGGELFGSLRPPSGSVAVEPYPPNVPVAARRLEPLGVAVVERTTDTLPVDDAGFDLVLNRHGSLQAAEIHRVLAPGGVLLTQQVGARNDVEFNEALDLPATVDPTTPSTVAELVAVVTDAGLIIDDVREARSRTRYLDIGAVIFQLRAVAWQVPGFDPVRHRERLRRLHDQIERTGGFEVQSQRFLLQARRPI